MCIRDRPGAEKLMCSTRQEMMEAVRKGKADAAFVYYYMAQAFVNSDTTGTMTYTLLEQPTFTYRMVISSTENHALAGILTKAMYAMPQNLVEDLAAQYTTYKATELTFVDWIRLHPVVTVLVLLIFGWLLTIMAATIVRLSARKKAQKEMCIRDRIITTVYDIAFGLIRQLQPDLLVCESAVQICHHQINDIADVFFCQRLEHDDFIQTV